MSGDELINLSLVHNKPHTERWQDRLRKCFHRYITVYEFEYQRAIGATCPLYLKQFIGVKDIARLVCEYLPRPDTYELKPVFSSGLEYPVTIFRAHADSFIRFESSHSCDNLALDITGQYISLWANSRMARWDLEKNIVQVHDDLFRFVSFPISTTDYAAPLQAFLLIYRSEEHHYAEFVFDMIHTGFIPYLATLIRNNEL